MVRRLTMNPMFLPGFSDAGAHLTNMAFYDINLRALRVGFDMNREQGVAYIAKRITRDAADFFEIDAGRLDVGERADITLIDPEKLKVYDGEAGVSRVYRETLGHDQLVNRSDGVVRQVFINGTSVFRDGQFTSAFENKKLGRVLRNKSAEIAMNSPTAIAAE